MQDLWLPAKSLASNSGNCQGGSHSLYQAFLLCGHSHPTSLPSVPGPAAISSLHWALKSLGLARFSSSQQASTTPQRGRVPSALQWGKNASFPWLDVLCEKIGPLLYLGARHASRNQGMDWRNGHHTTSECPFPLLHGAKPAPRLSSLDLVSPFTWISIAPGRSSAPL